jgi:hypothetical protein
MRVTTKKYGVLVSFCHKMLIFDKTVGLLMDFEQKFNFFENSYTCLLSITDL